MATIWGEREGEGEGEGGRGELAFDVADLEEVFAKRQPKAEGDGEKEGERDGVVVARRLYTTQRDVEIGILRARFSRHTVEELAAALDEGEGPFADDEDACLTFRSLAPTDEEVATLRREREREGGAFDATAYTVPTQFHFSLLASLSKPRLKAAFLAMRSAFPGTVDAVVRAATLVHRAAEQVSSSAPLRSVLKAVLKLGNALNAGTTWQSLGFRLESLAMLVNVRATTSSALPDGSSGTLLTYLITRLRADMPDLLEFGSTVPDVAAARELSLEEIAADLAKIGDRVDCVARPVADLSPATGVVRLAASWLEGPALDDLTAARTAVSDATAAYEGVVRKFGDDPRTTKPSSFFGNLHDFIEMFEREVARIVEKEEAVVRAEEAVAARERRNAAIEATRAERVAAETRRRALAAAEAQRGAALEEAAAAAGAGGAGGGAGGAAVDSPPARRKHRRKKKKKEGKKETQ
jgi:hypothetical protein